MDASGVICFAFCVVFSFGGCFTFLEVGDGFLCSFCGTLFCCVIQGRSFVEISLGERLKFLLSNFRCIIPASTFL